jgi:small subunit ribosomal protein S4e
MAKEILKRLAAPKTWHVERKKTKLITKPVPGPHKTENGIPLNILLKEILNYAKTTREVKKLLATNEIKIDGKARKDPRFQVGIFDSIEFTGINEHYRVILSKKGFIELLKISKEEASTKPCKIIGKTMVKGKLQLNLYDGKNIIADKKDYKVGDTVLLSFPGQKISKHLKMDKKSTIFLIGGKHKGETGNVENIMANRVVYKNHKGELIETSKDYAFVVVEQKSLIKLD